MNSKAKAKGTKVAYDSNQKKYWVSSFILTSNAFIRLSLFACDHSLILKDLLFLLCTGMAGKTANPCWSASPSSCDYCRAGWKVHRVSEQGWEGKPHTASHTAFAMHWSYYGCCF